MNFKLEYLYLSFVSLLICHRIVIAKNELLATIGGTSVDQSVETTLNLINEGDEKISILSSRRNIILMIGNTGAGKTTITKLLTMEVSDMESYYDIPRGGFLIRDVAKKIGSDSNSISRTIFPELFIDSKTNSAFYDTPGFSDTRNSSIELANSFFIKKIADHARRIKFVLIVNYSSLRQGESRNDFLNAVKHATILIKDTKKFSNATSLIASKVETTLDTDLIIEGIAAFLQGFLSDIPTVIQDKRQQLNARNFIEPLLTKSADGEGYSRIGILRSPNKKGHLDEIPITQNCKPHLHQIIYNNTHYVPSSSDDFSIPVSAETKLLSKNLIEIIGSKIVNETRVLSEAIKDHYNNEQSNNAHPCEDLLKLLPGFYIIQNTTTSMNTARDTEQVRQILSDNIASLPLNEIKKQAFLVSIEKNMKNLNFFVRVSTQDESCISSESRFYPKKWAEPLIMSQNYLKEYIHKIGSDLDESTTKWTRKMAEIYDESIQLKVTSYDTQDFSKLQGELGRELTNLHRIKQLVHTCEVKSPKQFVVETMKILGDSIIEPQISAHLSGNNDTFCDITSDSSEITTMLKSHNWVIPIGQNLVTVNELLNNVALHLRNFINSLQHDIVALNKTIKSLEQTKMLKTDEIRKQSTKINNLSSIVQEYKDNMHQLKQDHLKNQSNLDMQILKLNANMRSMEQNLTSEIELQVRLYESEKDIWTTKEKSAVELYKKEKENKQQIIKEKDESLARAIKSHTDAMAAEKKVCRDKETRFTKELSDTRNLLYAEKNKVKIMTTTQENNQLEISRLNLALNNEKKLRANEKNSHDTTLSQHTATIQRLELDKNNVGATLRINEAKCTSDKNVIRTEQNDANTKLLNCNSAKTALEVSEKRLQNQVKYGFGAYIIFEDENFNCNRGTRFLGKGTCIWETLTTTYNPCITLSYFSDRISSISTLGTCVRIWEHINCEGDYRVIRGEVGKLSDINFDNRMSSIGFCRDGD